MVSAFINEANNFRERMIAAGFHSTTARVYRRKLLEFLNVCPEVLGESRANAEAIIDR